jgi:hypothetical protein
LHHHDAKQIERADVFGLRVQNLFEGALRLGDLARLQKRKRASKLLVSLESHGASLYEWRRAELSYRAPCSCMEY